MKGTKEDVSKTINECADGMKEIANDILNNCYEPDKWKEISIKMSLVTNCLLLQGGEFCEGLNDTNVMFSREIQSMRKSRAIQRDTEMRACCDAAKEFMRKTKTNTIMLPEDDVLCFTYYDDDACPDNAVIKSIKFNEDGTIKNVFAECCNRCVCGEFSTSDFAPIDYLEILEYINEQLKD